MKLGRVAKFDNRNKKKRQKKIDDDAMSPNFDAIVIFSDLWTIWSPEAGFRTHSL